jgi:hypothetical protein
MLWFKKTTTPTPPAPEMLPRAPVPPKRAWPWPKSKARTIPECHETHDGTPPVSRPVLHEAFRAQSSPQSSWVFPRGGPRSWWSGRRQQ